METNYYRLNKYSELRIRYDGCFLINKCTMATVFLHPSEALILSLLKGNIDVFDLTFLIKETYSLTKLKAAELVINTLDKTKYFLDSSSEPFESFHKYNPKDYLKIFSYNDNILKSPLRTPMHLTIMLTQKCNFKCKYCFHETNVVSYNELPQNLVYDLIKQAKDLGVTSICLSGGEPLLYPNVYKIINAIITNDMVPFLSTNGSLLNESMVLSLLKSGLSSIQVSLDSSIPNIHHDMTQTQDTFNKVIDGIKLLKSKNIYVKINSVITIDNYSTIEQHIDALAKLNVDEIRLTWENAISCEKIIKHPNKTLNLELIKDLKEVVLNKQSKYKHCKILFSKSPLETWTNSQDIITCGNLMKAMVILPTGNVSICEMIQNDPTLVYGNVYQNTLKSIWLGKEHQKLLNKTLGYNTLNKDCSNCMQLDYCRTGCFNLSKLKTGDSLNKDPRCPGAAAMSVNNILTKKRKNINKKIIV